MLHNGKESGGAGAGGGRKGKCRRPTACGHTLDTVKQKRESCGGGVQGGGDFVPNQIRGGTFRRGKFTQNPEFRVGDFAANLKCAISHTKSTDLEPPPPPPQLCDIQSIGGFVVGPWTVTR